jgi:hypothetical protein
MFFLCVSTVGKEKKVSKGKKLGGRGQDGSYGKWEGKEHRERRRRGGNPGAAVRCVEA